MLKQLKDLTIYEAWELSKKYCSICENLSNEEFNEMCGKCPFNSEAERNDNCPLCNNLFSEVGNLSEADLEKTVEVDSEDECYTIYADDNTRMIIRDLQYKLNHANDINDKLNVKNGRLAYVIEQQYKTIKSLVDIVED